MKLKNKHQEKESLSFKFIIAIISYENQPHL